MINNRNKYTLFIDESGVGNLNHPGSTFVLATVLVSNEDLSVIQGYLRMIKRDYLGNENANIHSTDLFERTYSKYRRLLKPKDRRHSFLTRIQETLKIIPFHCAIYYVNKDRLRRQLKYKPYPKKKSTNVNADLPYELASKQAIFDYVSFLKKSKSFGEIIIESRQFNDKSFVGYFDDVRKNPAPGNVTNPLAQDVRLRVNSLSICNKDYFHSGLELADLGAYTTYRKIQKDPDQRMKISIGFCKIFQKILSKKSYVSTGQGEKLIELGSSYISVVKPSKQI